MTRMRLRWYSLNAQKCVVLGQTLGASRGASLDLADTERNCNISDDGILRLSAPVRNHDTPAIRLCKLRTERKQEEGRLIFT